MNLHTTDMINQAVSHAVLQAGIAATTYTNEQLPILIAHGFALGIGAGFMLAFVAATGFDLGLSCYCAVKSAYLSRRAKRGAADAGI